MSHLPKDFSERADDRDPGFEPYESGNPIPWPLLAVVLALVVWGGLTIWRDATLTPKGESAQVDANVSASEAPGSEAAGQRNDPALAERVSAAQADGGTLFGEYCATCHQSNGSGVRAAIPPLQGARYVLADAAVPATILLRGISGPIEVQGAVYNGRMPTFGATLSDGQIARILTYVRGAWGNDAAAITPDVVASLRAELPPDGLVPLSGGAELEALFGIPVTAPANALSTTAADRPDDDQTSGDTR